MPAFPLSFHNVKDKADGRLSVGIGTVDTSLTLQTGEGGRFPTGDFIIYCEDERIHVGSRSGDVCSSLTRGYDGSTAVTHASLAPLVLPFTQGVYNRIISNLTGHTHTKADVTDFSHSHPQGDVTNLTTDLAAKEATANKNAASGYAGLSAGSKIAASQISEVLAATDLTSYATESGTGTAAIRATVTSPATNQVLAWNGTNWVNQAAGGGSDPWTYVKLASVFTTSSATAVDVTGMGFTPAASTSYEFEGTVLLRTTSAAVNPRLGLAWPTGFTDGGAILTEAQAATGNGLSASGNPNAALLIPVGGLPNTTQSWPAILHGIIVMGASPSGTVKLQLASETSGTNVTMQVGSFFRYRTIP